MSNAKNSIVLNSTFAVPVLKYNKDGEPQPKQVEYEIKTEVGSNAYIVKVTLSEFAKNQKDGQTFISFEVDHHLNFIYTAYSVKNTKGFLTVEKSLISNLTSVILDDFLNIKLEKIKSDNTDKLWFLLHSILPLLETEDIGTLQSLKVNVKRKIKQLSEIDVLTVWANLDAKGDNILQKYITYANDKLTAIKAIETIVDPVVSEPITQPDPVVSEPVKQSQSVKPNNHNRSKV